MVITKYNCDCWGKEIAYEKVKYTDIYGEDCVDKETHVWISYDVFDEGKAAFFIYFKTLEG